MNPTARTLFIACALAFSISACGDGRSDGNKDLAPDSSTSSTTDSGAAATDTASSEIDSSSALTDVAADGSTTTRVASKLNINTASNAELHTIANAGDKMVHEFEEYRPYTSIVQFRKQIGKYVDANQVAEFEKFIFVPVDMNSSDVATLRQIPGLDATEADALMKGRPYSAKDAFMQKLATMVSNDEALIAAGYLSHESK